MDYDETTERILLQGEPFGIRLYSILVPIIGVVAIVLNSIVVYSSGLLIEMSEWIENFQLHLLGIGQKKKYKNIFFDPGQHPRSCYMFLGKKIKNILTL